MQVRAKRKRIRPARKGNTLLQDLEEANKRGAYFDAIAIENKLAFFDRRRERARISTHWQSEQYVILNTLIRMIRENDIQMLFIDLFAGAGGVSEGIYMAELAERKCALTYYAVNHDPLAIQSHAANHGYAFHADEHIRTFDLTHLAFITEILRKIFPHIKINLWASLECTNFSRAKGGKEKNADSRTLAEHLYRYIEAINPDMIWIENVTEFMAWGPLDENNKPISKKNGIDFIHWKEHLESYGYRCEYKELNAADYGAYTSRIRLFMQFAKPGIEIVWPQATHVKAAKLAKQQYTGDLFNYKPLIVWKAVKDVLDFTDSGNSILQRATQLSEKTLQRIYAGLIKYIAGGKEVFMMQQYSGDPKGKVFDLDRPARVITATGGNQNIVSPQFIMKYYSGNPEHMVASVEDPAATLRKNDTLSLVQPDFLMKYYSNGGQHDSVEGPAGTIPTKDRIALIRTNWIARDFSRPAYYSGVEEPVGSLPANPKANLVTAESLILNKNSSTAPANNIENPAPTLTGRTHYLINPQWGLQDSSVEKPCFTLIARMDKAPPYLVNVDEGGHNYAINLEQFFAPLDWQYVSDVAHDMYGPLVAKSVRVDIVEFMGMYGIVDIKMRMLKVAELKLIQGFKPAYVLLGSQTHQKKFIGNSVPPPMVKAMMEASSQYYKAERKAA